VPNGRNGSGITIYGSGMRLLISTTVRGILYGPDIGSRSWPIRMPSSSMCWPVLDHLGAETMASAGFRAGTAALIWRSTGELMVFERADHAGAWQVPQGGIHPGESALVAVWREVREETGLGPEELVVAGEHPHWTVYTFPDGIGRGSWLGQVLRWFHFKVRDDAVEPTPDLREFVNWGWMSPSAVLDGIVDFKFEVYSEVLAGCNGLSPVDLHQER